MRMTVISLFRAVARYIEAFFEVQLPVGIAHSARVETGIHHASLK